MDVANANVLIDTDWSAFAKGVKHVLMGAATSPSGGRLLMNVFRPAGPNFIVQITDPLGARDGRTVQSLFDIFTDDRDASPTKYGGAGIGLALGLRFMRVLGGEITVSHEPKGARIFTITVPVQSAAAPKLAMAS